MRDRKSLPGRASQWDAMRSYQHSFLFRKGLEPYHAFLDIGCGPLRGGVPIIRYLDTGNYVGLEKWQESIAVAWDVVKEEGIEEKEPILILGDATSDLDLRQEFDCILAFSVMHHLYDAEVGKLVEFVKRHLSPGGAFFCTALIGDYKQLPDWFHYPIISRPLAHYQTAAEQNGLNFKHEEVVPVLHSEHMMRMQSQKCIHGQDDPLDCSTCGKAVNGGSDWRRCHHGSRRGECPSCNGGEVEYELSY